MGRWRGREGSGGREGGRERLRDSHVHGVARRTHTQHASACTSLHLQHTFLLSHVNCCEYTVSKYILVGLFPCSVSLVCGTCMACLCESATCVHGCLTLHLMYTCLCVMLCVCACVDAWVELATVTLSYSQRYVQSSLKMDV